MHRTVPYPLKWVPFFRFFSTPLSNSKITAFLIHKCPYIEGASEFPSRSNVSFLLAISFILLRSSKEYIGAFASLFNKETLLAIRTVLRKLTMLFPARENKL